LADTLPPLVNLPSTIRLSNPDLGPKPLLSRIPALIFGDHPKHFKMLSGHFGYLKILVIQQKVMGDITDRNIP
jgi:hypothetical protein